MSTTCPTPRTTRRPPPAHRTPPAELRRLAAPAVGAAGPAEPPGHRARRSSTAPSTSTASASRQVAARGRPADGHRARRLRLARAVRADARPSSRPIAAALRPAPAGRRGRRRTPTSGPSSSSYDDALFMVLKTAPLRGARGAHRHQRGRRHRRGDGLPRAALRDHRPARRPRRADGPAAAGWRTSPTCSASAPPRCSTPSPTSSSTHFVEVADRRGGGRRRARGVGVQPGPHRRHRPDLPAQARADAAAPGGRAAGGPAARSWPSATIDVVPDAMRSYFRDVLDHALRVRDQVAALDELLTSILQAVARPHLAGRQRGHPQDLGLGRRSSPSRR